MSARNPDDQRPAPSPDRVGTPGETPRFRFAPSPTGSLHVGGARTAILNWLLARKSGGSFVLRIEDTDLERNVAGAEQQLLDDLRWLGLDWDEGPGVGGPFAPYRQSERQEQHRDAASQLLATGQAYLCTCPPGTQATGERRPRCPCASRAGDGTVRDGASIRILAPLHGEIVVRDAIRGEVVFPADSVEDFVLLRSDGRATYNFAAAVDDAAMQITDVVRGADHLNNTPKQVVVYRALGLPEPHWAHIPLILGPDRQKLSKRHGATSVAEHRRLGYLPEALVNYLSLLSWSSASGEEFLDRDRLVTEVDLARVGASDAVYDPEKLRWLSHRHLQTLSPDQLLRRAEPFLGEGAREIEAGHLPEALAAVQERTSVLSELEDQLAPFRGPHTDAHELARRALLEQPETMRLLEAIAASLEALPVWTAEQIGATLREQGRALGFKGRALFQPLRIGLTGEEHGPDLGRITLALGRTRASSLLRMADLQV